MVVWLTGEVTQVQQAFRVRVPGLRVCIKGQARFSESELESARQRADAVLTQSGTAWS